MVAPLPLSRLSARFRTRAARAGVVAGPIRFDGGMLVALLLLTAPWAWPTDPPHSVVRPYVAPETPYSAGHRGVDLSAPTGTVYAPDDGVVHFAGTVVDRPVLSIEQSGGVITSFEPVETSLVAGDLVERGDVIGSVLPGHCASPCLHLGVRVHGEYASPLAWLGGVPPAVLLPTRERPPTAKDHGSGKSSACCGRALRVLPAQGRGQ